MLKTESKTEFINQRLWGEPESRKKLSRSQFATILLPAEAANTRLPTTETCRSPSCTSPK